MKKNNLRKGFTLIELLAVIVILAILVAAAVPAISKYLSTTKKKVYVVDASTMVSTVGKSVALESLSEGVIYYQLDTINELMRTKFLKSSYGNEYSKTSYVKIVVDSEGQKTYSVCLSDGENTICQASADLNVDNLQISTDICEPTITGSELFAQYNSDTKTITFDGSAYAEEGESTTGDLVIDLASNMIPVYYDSADGNWKKADQTNTNNQWYDYDNSKWANAVTVEDTNRDTYLSASVGTIIPVVDLNLMVVWIPRYEYKINGVEEAMDINFISKTIDVATDGFRIHPAFTFGETDLSGLWVGKFEYSNTLDYIKDVPNEGYSLYYYDGGYISLADFFVATREMGNLNNPYGFVSSEVDTHVIKNSEWGAIAYLSQSIKGKCTDATTCPAVYIDSEYLSYNNSSSSALIASISLVMGGPGPSSDYSREEVFTGSTTQNIYGVYDMVSKQEDVVMAFNSLSVAGSGFNGDNYSGAVSDGVDMPESKYYDFYDINSLEQCTTEICGGHALDETFNWYGSSNTFPYDTSSSDYNLMTRGGYYGPSIFVQERTYRLGYYTSTRLVIAAE